MKYELLEHIADMGLLIYGSSVKELFENAGFALFDQMADLSTVEATDTIEISAEGGTLEELFLNWLRELLYQFHGERRLLKEFDVKEIRDRSLKAIVRGERIDPERHLFGIEIKAATYHNLEIKETGKGWEARVILDV